MSVDTKPVAELIERLYTERFEVNNLLVVYDHKDSETGTSEFCIGMSHGTNLSWFLKAKEWVTWLLYTTMTGYHVASAVEARRDREFLEQVQPEPGSKPS